MLEPTSEVFHQEVCQKFNTSLQQMQQDVKVLKEWIRQQPHLPQCSSDTMLTTFLVACKNRMERAKEKIDNYYSARLDIPEFFGDRDPEGERVRLITEEIKMFTLPKLTPDGCRVTMAIYVTGDPTKYDVPAFCKRIMAYEDVRINKESFYLGDYLILDCELFSALHLVRLTPSLARDLLYCIQDVMPIIVKGVIVINCTQYMYLAVNVMKPFMKGKLIERIHIHTEGQEVLEKYFPKSILPKDYGGEEATSAELHESWANLLREKRGWLMGEGALTVDERKRIGGPNSRKERHFEEMKGSFKTLCVD